MVDLHLEIPQIILEMDSAFKEIRFFPYVNLAKDKIGIMVSHEITE